MLFHHPTADQLDDFAAAYGHDLREWPHLPTLIAIREITSLSPYIRTAADNPTAHHELTHRLHTLHQADDTTPWTSPTGQGAHRQSRRQASGSNDE